MLGGDDELLEDKGEETVAVVHHLAPGGRLQAYHVSLHDGVELGAQVGQPLLAAVREGVAVHMKDVLDRTHYNQGQEVGTVQAGQEGLQYH